MSKVVRQYLRDMVEHLDKVATFTQDGRDAFYADEKTQFAVIRAYEVIGEIVKRLPLETRSNNPQIDWRTLAGFRDFLAHSYDQIVLKFVWQAVEDVTTLRMLVQTVLENLPSDTNETDEPQVPSQ